MLWIATGLTTEITGVERLVIESVRSFEAMDVCDQTVLVTGDPEWAQEIEGIASVVRIATKAGGVARAHRAPRDAPVAHSFVAPFHRGSGSRFRSYTVHDWGPFWDREIPLGARLAWAAAMTRGIVGADAVHVLSRSLLDETPVPFRRLMERRRVVDGLPATMLARPMGDLHTRQSRRVLAVGTNVPRKQFDLLAKACLELPGVELVLAGRGTEALSASRGDNESVVRGLGRVSDEQLMHLYESSSLFVLPSTYEGFGLPVLEAWQHGCRLLVTEQVSRRLPLTIADAAGTIPAPVSPHGLAYAIAAGLADERSTTQGEVVVSDAAGSPYIAALAHACRMG